MPLDLGRRNFQNPKLNPKTLNPHCQKMLADAERDQLVSDAAELASENCLASIVATASIPKRFRLLSDKNRSNPFLCFQQSRDFGANHLIGELTKLNTAATDPDSQPKKSKP